MLRFGVGASARGPLEVLLLAMPVGNGRGSGLRGACFLTRGFVFGRERRFGCNVFPVLVTPLGVAPAGVAGEALILGEGV